MCHLKKDIKYYEYKLIKGQEKKPYLCSKIQNPSAKLNSFCYQFSGILKLALWDMPSVLEALYI